MKINAKKFAEKKNIRTFAIPIQGTHTAEIAQLVAHNLAKVGFAGASPVFRSYFDIFEIGYLNRAQVAELVDAHVSGACVSQRAGSSPVLGTMFKLA